PRGRTTELSAEAACELVLAVPALFPGGTSARIPCWRFLRAGAGPGFARVQHRQIVCETLPPPSPPASENPYKLRHGDRPVRGTLSILSGNAGLAGLRIPA